MRHETAIQAGGVLAAALGGAVLYTRIMTKRIESEVPADGNFVDVAGARLHYVERGAGPPIVLLHGLGAQLRNFLYGVADALAEDFRVILVDRPGSGYSTPVGDQPGILAQGVIVAAFIGALKLERPFVNSGLGRALLRVNRHLDKTTALDGSLDDSCAYRLASGLPDLARVK